MTPPSSLQIIRREHAALAAVLRTVAQMVRAARHRNRTPDFHALRAMLFYVSEYPERLHHVKETTMLFPRIRHYTREANDVLAALDGEHARGEEMIHGLSHLLAAWEWLGESRRDTFEQALERYTAFYLKHMRTEEVEVLPLAERLFGDDDWRVLDRAFLAHRDPLTGHRAEAPYEALFVGSSRVDLQACKLEYSIVSPK